MVFVLSVKAPKVRILELPCSSLANPMQIPFFSHSKERTCNEFGTDLKRINSEPETKEKQRDDKPQVNFFLELNAKHVHGGKNRDITDCVPNSLRACICLSNTYTSHTQHVHVFANALKKQNNIAHFRNLKGVTTRVCVVYMLDKHIHALNLLGINTITNVFMGRVRV